MLLTASLGGLAYIMQHADGSEVEYVGTELVQTLQVLAKVSYYQFAW
jgi:hypothetical protein